MSALDRKAIGSIVITLLVMAAMLFISAGTTEYWQAWVFLIVFGVSALAITAYLMRTDPKLLERRLRVGPGAESAPGQKVAVAVAFTGFVAILVVSGLDQRFGWSTWTPGMAMLGEALIALGFLICFFVYRVNTYASATIEIAPGQTVISTGPYAIVRHPMYSGGLMTLLGMPIALGSWWGLLPAIAIAPALIWRLLDEEQFLVTNLRGYAQYRNAVRYRLVPWVW